MHPASKVGREEQSAGKEGPGARMLRSQGARGCKARGRKQDFRAKVSTKKKPPNSVP